MIQVPENIRMFAAFSARTRHTILSDGYFYGHTGALYPKDIRLSNPHALLSLDSNLFLPKRGKDNLSFYLICNISFMARTMKFCNAGNNSTYVSTSAHETRISSKKAKWLKPSYTLASRKSFVSMFRELYPSIYRMKVKHTSYLFIVRADACGRELHAAAYTLERLAEKFHSLCNQRLGELS